MTRHALVIGLGGTGAWVLTYLKKDLIESNGGVMPDNVKLLAFDTVTQTGASAGSAQGNDRNKDKVVGAIRLKPKEEYFHLGGDMYDVGVAVSDGAKRGQQTLPHVASWFAADHWLTTLPRASWSLAAGAGQLRQFGRLGLFSDLRARNKSEIWSRIDVAVGSLARKFEGKERLEIIIIGSFAGGTGSGMFLDVALLARHRAKSVSNVVRGYFALPEVFDPDPDNDMLARSFAAWRELNRFMVINQYFTMPNLVYNSADSALQIKDIKTRAFDACYLVDGVRDGVRVAADAEAGVHPIIADAISALLDDEAGKAYTEYVTENLSPEYAARPGIPLYSAVGAHSYKVPVYYDQEIFAHRLSLDLLDHLLSPVRNDPQNRGRITGVSPTNPQHPDRVGRDDSPDVLIRDQEYRSASEKPTLFTARIARIYTEGGINNPDLVASVARGSMKGGYVWLKDFTDLGDRDDLRKVSQDIQREATLTITGAFKTSKDLKERPSDGLKRLQSQPSAFIREHYGGRDASGKEFGGKFGDVLDVCGTAQVDIFRRQVRLWLLDTLMGRDQERPLQSKGGKVGYAYDCLDGLAGILQGFLNFMDRVDEMRQGEIQPRLVAQQLQSRKLQAMNEAANKRLLVWDHPTAHNTQAEYLRATDALVNTRKDELLHKAIIQASRAMLAYAQEVRDELERWVRLLVTGDPATDVTGVIDLLRKSQGEIQATTDKDALLTGVQTVIRGQEYPDTEAELQRLMRAVTWRIDDSNREFSLALSFEPVDEPHSDFERPTGREDIEARGHITQRNLDTMLGYARTRFSQMPMDVRVADRLAKKFAYTASQFVKDLGDQADPLFDPHSTAEGGSAKWAKLIRLIRPDNTEFSEPTRKFVKEIEADLRRKAGVDVEHRNQDKLVEVVGSANLHKCTAVYTGDLYEVGQFKTWEKCQKAYVENTKLPPHLNHIFPAEANAARYEMMLSQKRQLQYKVFHPWVVMLLEDAQKAHQFFQCWALGYIAMQDDGVNLWYEFRLPSFNRPFMLTPRTKSKPSMFQVMRSFVLVGLDQAPQSNWALNYNKVQDAIDNEERAAGKEGWIGFLTTQKDSTNPSGVVGKLNAIDQDLAGELEHGRSLPSDEPANFHEAYIDLANLAALMFEERIEQKERSSK